MKQAAIDLTEKVNNVIVKFCSENCKAYFHCNPTIVNLLPATFKVAVTIGDIVLTLPSGHTMLQDVKDYYDECGEELAAKQTVQVCVGNGSMEYPKDKIYITYVYSTVLYKTTAAFFVNNDLTLSTMPVPLQSRDIGVAELLIESIQKRVTPMLEAIATEDGFSSFSAWCSLALRSIGNKAMQASAHASDFHNSKMLYNNETCSYCSQHSDILKKCSRCRLVQYCGRECQKKHWNTHKSHCQPFS